MKGAMEKLRHSDADTASELNSVRVKEEREEATTGAIVQDKLFVAVGKEVKASKSTLLWALQSSVGKKICLLHVHQPAQTVSMMGGKFPLSTLGELEVKAHHEKERQAMIKVLEEYLKICAQAGVQAEKVYTDNVSIEEGIIELIAQLRIGKLVMGAASDSKYSRKMIEPRSKKAIHVRERAPSYCHILFICKGRLIYTREGNEGLNFEDGGNGWKPMNSLPYPSSGYSTPKSKVDSERSFDELDRSSEVTVSHSSDITSPLSLTNSPFHSFIRMEDREVGGGSWAGPQPKEYGGPSAPGVESSMNDTLFEQLEQAMEEAENSRRQAFDESIKRRKAEKDSVNAIRKANSMETLYLEELKRRREVEEELAKAKEELENANKERELVSQQLVVAQHQKSSLENRVEKSDHMVKELEEKMVSALEILRNYRL